MTAQHALLTAVNEESKSIKEVKNDIIAKFAGKELHEIFEQYITNELK